MSKVSGIIYDGTEFDEGNYIGFTECCGEPVGRSRSGCDEYCPKCGAWLDWSGEDE